MRFIGLLLMLAAASAVPLSDVEVYDIEEAERHFEEFIQTFERNYETEEEKMMRLEVFTNNLKSANELNAKRTQEHQAVFGITKFADYTNDEFRAFIGRPFLEHNGTKIIEISDIGNIGDLPDQFDWRKKNKVTSVKNQGPCGSCWAFSATACVESAIAIKYNKIFDIAEQQLVDCDVKSLGCGGAYTLYAGFEAYKTMKGSMTEKDYPYTHKTGKCKYSKAKSVAQLLEYAVINDKNRKENEVKYFKVALKTGPISVGLAADGWGLYKKGIYEGDSELDVNHAVLMVGYGIEKGVPYWIIKNSWSDIWGEEGYIRLKAGKNTCNIMYTAAATVTDIKLV